MRTTKYIVSGKVNDKIIEHITDSYKQHIEFLKKILPKLKIDSGNKTIREQLVSHTHNIYKGTFTDLGDYDFISTYTFYVRDNIDGYDIYLAFIDVSTQIDELSECEI